MIEPGDEVVLFQPMYDAYLPLVRRAGGVAKFVTLKPPLWTFDEADLEAAFSPRTRVVLFNNPLNPTGVVYGRESLEILARACVKHDVVALCDEVWEHVIFDGRRHIPLMAMEGMRERTVKIGSAGKIFSLTGWKVGFVCAAAPILRVLAKAHQFITFTTPPNLQTAVAYGLMKDDAYFTEMRAAFQRSRDRFSDGLKARGFHGAAERGNLFPQHRHRARWGATTMSRSAAGWSKSTASRRSRCRRFTPRLPFERSCAFVSPSATRRSTPRSIV